jgi:predicted enzyme related to lactoylglutathione lyase
MKLSLARVIIFVRDMQKAAAFYRNILGLEAKICSDDPKDWQEFQAGSITIALHLSDAPKPRRIATKIVFYSADVKATKQQLEARGAKLGRILRTEDFEFCNGTDPEGNPFSISSRV